MNGIPPTAHHSGFDSRVPRALATRIVSLLLLSPAAVHAVGLGSYEVQSALGQALRMSVQVSARPDEQIEPTCFRLNPFSVAGDGLPQLTNAQMTLERRGGETRLLVTSARAILDPIVRIAIDVGCETTLRREITLLLDPPTAVESLPQTADARPAGVPIPPAGRTAPAATGDAAGRTDTQGSPGAQGAAGTPSAAARPGDGAALPPRPPRSSTAAVRPPAPSMVSPAPARAAPPLRVPLIPRAETVGPLAQGEPARPPRTLPPAVTQSPRGTAPTPTARAQREPSRDRLSISTSPLPLGSSGATLTPRLNLATSLGDSRRQPALSENAMSLLRQKQARLRAAPAGEDLPSLEAELVVLQKRTAEMQRQLDLVMSQMAAMRAASGAGGSSSAATATAPAQSASLSPTIATAPVVASAPAAPGQPADTESAAAPIRSATDSNVSWTNFINDSRVLIGGPLLLAILLLFLGLVVWLRRERDEARRSDRWNLKSYAGSPIAAPVVSPPTPRTSFEAEAPLPPSAAPGPITQRGTAPDTRRGPDAYQFTTYSSGQDAQELGVSDLAQATEKASVFVTLGRPEQAIDVLRDHIDHEAKSSPMAWLMLLDLYRQTARNQDFNDIAERFHLEFNAVTPEWVHAIAPLHDAGLAAFPYLIARIRDAWPGPKARTFIEDLLYDNRGGSRIGFSIPAFRDLLMLHSMIEEHLVALDKHGRIDPDTGNIIEAPPAPEPPAHLSSIWATASPERPAYTSPPPGLPGMAAPAKATLAFDMGSIAGSMDRSALEKSYPIIVEALVSRWGKSGLAAYLSNLIRSSADRGAGLSNDALSEMILLHDIALDLGEPEPTFSIS